MERIDAMALGIQSELPPTFGEIIRCIKLFGSQELDSPDGFASLKNDLLTSGRSLNISACSRMLEVGACMCKPFSVGPFEFILVRRMLFVNSDRGGSSNLTALMQPS